MQQKEGRISVYWQGIAGTIFSTFLWGIAWVMTRYLVKDMPPFTVSFWRLFFTFVALLPFVFLHYRQNYQKNKNDQKVDCQALKKKSWLLILMAIFGVIGWNLFMALGVQYISASEASIVNASTPFIIGVLSCIFLKNKLSLRFIIGLIIAFFGVFLSVNKGFSGISINIGVLIILSGSFCWSIYTLLTKIMDQKIPYIIWLTILFIIGIIIMLPLLIYEGMPISSYTGRQILLLVALGVFPGAIANLLWVRGVKILGPAYAGIIMNLVPLFATVSGILFLKESTSIIQITGFIILLFGVFFGTFVKGKKAPKPTNQLAPANQSAK